MGRTKNELAIAADFQLAIELNVGGPSPAAVQIDRDPETC
jgi:hypothetical protein